MCTVREALVAPVAVVGRGPDCEDGVVEVPLVALHDELVRTTDELERVVQVEFGGHVGAEEEAGAARRHAPSESVFYTLINCFVLQLELYINIKN